MLDAPPVLPLAISDRMQETIVGPEKSDVGDSEWIRFTASRSCPASVASATQDRFESSVASSALL